MEAAIDKATDVKGASPDGAILGLVALYEYSPDRQLVRRIAQVDGVKSKRIAAPHVAVVSHVATALSLQKS